jgi:hypothetical protein
LALLEFAHQTETSPDPELLPEVLPHYGLVGSDDEKQQSTYRDQRE